MDSAIDEIDDRVVELFAKNDSESNIKLKDVIKQLIDTPHS